MNNIFRRTRKATINRIRRFLNLVSIRTTSIFNFYLKRYITFFGYRYDLNLDKNPKQALETHRRWAHANQRRLRDTARSEGVKGL